MDENGKIEKNEMSYKKCLTCSHCEHLYDYAEPGLTLLCKITGDILQIKKCPEKDDGNDQCCSKDCCTNGCSKDCNKTS